MKRIVFIFTFIMVTAFVFTSCPTQTMGNIDNPPGFLKGILHGFILLFSFVTSLFTDYEIYAYPNTTAW